MLGKIDLTPLIQAIIVVLSLIITYKVVPYLKSKLSESNYRYLKSVVETLVFAAEQLYGAGEGDKKLDYVLSKLDEKGFTADRDVIEEYVYKLTHGGISLNTVDVVIPGKDEEDPPQIDPPSTDEPTIS